MRYYLIYIFLLSQFITNNNFAQSFDTLNYRATFLLKQAFFSDNIHDELSYKLERIQVLKKLGEFDLIEDELEAISYFEYDSLRYKIEYEKALIYYLNGDLKLAYSQTQIIDRKLDSYSNNKSYLNLKAFVMLSEMDIKGLRSFKENRFFCENYDTSMFYSLVNELEQAKFKNPNTSEWLSTFVPGLGQAYSGFWGEGISGFSLNLIALGFMGYNFWLTNYITTFTVGSGLLQKFYFGSRRRSHYLAEVKNEKIIQSFLLQMESVLK